jgi:hypothetical protein
MVRGDSHVPLPPALDNWDPAVPLEIAASFVTNVESILADCDLPPDSTVRCTLVWHSPGTSLQGGGQSLEIASSDGMEVRELRTSIDGDWLAGSVRADLIVSASAGLDRGGPLAPQLVGATLWSDSTTVLLEGSGTRFPTEWADFEASLSLPNGAAWYLQWPRDDLHQSVGGSLRLYLNASSPRLRAAFESHGDVSESLLADFVLLDVGRMLVTAALRSGEFVGDPESFEGESVGATVRRLLEATFPYDSIPSLSEHLRHDPGRFEAELQERLRFLEARH